MDSLINYIMGTSTSLDIYVMLRLSLVYACLELIREIAVTFGKGATK